MAAPAAGAVPVAGLAVALLTQVLGWAVCFGLLWAYNGSFRVIIQAFAGWLGDFGFSVARVRVAPFRPVAAALRGLDNKIVKALEAAIEGEEVAIAFLWDQITATVNHMTRWAREFAQTVEGGRDYLYRTVLPREHRQTIEQAKRSDSVIAGSLAAVTTVALPGMRSRADTLTDRVGRIDLDLRGIRARVRAHERTLAWAGVGALGLTMLRKLGLRWLRCGNMRRFGKRFCGLDPSVLDAALLAGTMLGMSFSIERVTREMLGTMDTFEAALRRGFTEI